jgi:hypothetical protein
MQERWARDFMADSYGKGAYESLVAKTAGKFIGYNNEGGASYIVSQSPTKAVACGTKLIPSQRGSIGT